MTWSLAISTLAPPSLATSTNGDIEVALNRADEAAATAWIDLLSPQEHAGAARFRHAEDRRRFIVGRGVLRSLLGRRLDRAPESLALEVDAHGKPTLADARAIAFNVSHSGDYVLAAVGRAAAIGVDIEEMRSDIDVAGLGRKVFTPAELASILDAPDAERMERFYRQWTLKEATAKAVGLGLALGFQRFEIAFADGRPELTSHGLFQRQAAARWRLQTVEAPSGYAAALAVSP